MGLFDKLRETFEVGRDVLTRTTYRLVAVGIKHNDEWFAERLSCPVCGSSEVYVVKEEYSYIDPELTLGKGSRGCIAVTAYSCATKDCHCAWNRGGGMSPVNVLSTKKYVVIKESKYNEWKYEYGLPNLKLY